MLSAGRVGNPGRLQGRGGLGPSLGELVEDNGAGSGKSATRQAEAPPILIPTLGSRARAWEEMETSQTGPWLPTQLWPGLLALCQGLGAE